MCCSRRVSSSDKLVLPHLSCSLVVHSLARVSDHKIDDNSINSPQKHSTRVLHECVDCFPQVVDTSGRMNPTSLSLHIFGGEIPNDRKTEYRSEFAEVSSTPTMFLQHSAPTFGR